MRLRRHQLTECSRAGHSTEGWPGWLLAFRYDAELVERLKAAVPHWYREWRPEEKRWWVHKLFEAKLEELFSNFTMFRDQRRLPL